MNKISGIYKITNKITNECYIGSSRNINERWINHKSLSTWSNNSGMKLYKAFSEYGLNNFIFEIIEETDNLREREQYWIEKLSPSYNSIRSKRLDEKRYIQHMKEYYKTHQEDILIKRKEYYESNKEEILTKSKEYRKFHRAEIRARNKAYNGRLCSYESETLTLNALIKRFRKQGIPNPTQEAKKYLIKE